MQRRVREYTQRRWPLRKGMSNTFRLAIFFLVFSHTAAMAAKLEEAPTVLEWSQLPSLPDPIGFAGPFVGVSNDALIVAGGSNFPDGPPWEGHPKVWDDQVFVLADPQGKWISDFKLSRPLGYGVSITWKDRVVCLGGGDRDQHYADAFMLYWTGNKLETISLPSMPRPCAFSAGVLVGNIVYVAGGRGAWEFLGAGPIWSRPKYEMGTTGAVAGQSTNTAGHGYARRRCISY